MNGLRHFLAAGMTVFAALFSSCALLGVGLPKEYVPDDKVVFLKQRVDLDPIRYDGVPADPYLWPIPDDPINREKPSFLKVENFSVFLEPDYRNDARTYREAVAHFQYIMKHPLYAELKAKLEKAGKEVPEPYPPDKGDLVKEYTNAMEYAYPKYENATITFFPNGDYRIAFSDKSTFIFIHDSSYRLEGADKKIIFQVWKNDGIHEYISDGWSYSIRPKTRKIESDRGSLSIHSGDEPQIEFTLPGSKDKYVFFTKDQSSYREYTCVRSNGIRFDYIPDERHLLITYGTQAVSINESYEKIQSHFNVSERKATGLVSYYLPEGIRFTGIDSGNISYSEITPRWPEKYQSKRIGPFNVLYLPADEPLLAKLDAGRLGEVESFCGKMTGVYPAKQRTIIIPPDMNSYRKLHAITAHETMSWYPSGFQTKDLIVMWPLSVPRYRSDAGQEYFFTREIYEILAHEYTHLIVGEATGIICPVPVWLNEGLAVYVETRYSDEARRYWDVTFEASRKLGRLLPWDDIAENGTGAYPIAQARVHYAQSYAVTKALIGKYGISRVAEYIRSFRQMPRDDSFKVDYNIRELYKRNFREVFGVEWNGDGLIAIDETVK